MDEAFSTFMLVLLFYFLHRWKDLSQYQWLILQTYRQFSSHMWLSYDWAFSQPTSSIGLVDWSEINLQLFSFHMTNSLPCWSSNVPLLLEPSSSSTSCIVRWSWDMGQCSAPSAACWFAHRCTSCSAAHHASFCPGRMRQWSDKSKLIPSRGHHPLSQYDQVASCNKCDCSSVLGHALIAFFPSFS